MELKNRIKKVRQKSKLTQEKFGERIGVSKMAITYYENGNRTPQPATIKLICKEFSINETWLLTGEGDMDQPMSEEQEIAQITASLFNEDDQRRINLFKFIASLDEEDMEALERLWVKAEDFFKKGE